MQILVLLGMYFDAVVVFVTSQTLLFRLALAIMCIVSFSSPQNSKGPFFDNIFELNLSLPNICAQTTEYTVFLRKRPIPSLWIVTFESKGMKKNKQNAQMEIGFEF